MRLKQPEGWIYLYLALGWIGCAIWAMVSDEMPWWILLIPPPCPFGCLLVFGVVIFCHAWERGKR
jgi:hypothetical protein